MTTLFASILAMALVAQIQGGTIQGKVVDDQGKPVADAQVVFFAARHFDGSGDPVEVQTKTDAGLFDKSPSNLVMLLGWYDREVAAALFEPVRAQIEQTDDRELAVWGNQFLSWSIFDPRAAVARLEQVFSDTGLSTGAYLA